MLNVRLSPAYKKALATLAAQEHRTISGQIEHWIATHAADEGVTLGTAAKRNVAAKRTAT